jgi:hypothetical protein
VIEDYRRDEVRAMATWSIRNLTIETTDDGKIRITVLGETFTGTPAHIESLRLKLGTAVGVVSDRSRR